jgi:RNA polymerase sigma-70 factor (ECF subfamily)
MTAEPGGGMESDELETDEDRMAALAGGSIGSSSAAFEELFARYRQPVYGFFRRRVSEPEQAEELVQETFLALLRAAPRYRATASFRTYLYAIALNLLRAHRRKASFRAMFHGTGGEREPAARETLSAEVILRDALGKLERVDREVLMLREFEQLSYAEIGELLNLPLNTVRSRLFRARAALRDMLSSRSPKVSGVRLLEEQERV